MGLITTRTGLLLTLGALVAAAPAGNTWAQGRTSDPVTRVAQRCLDRQLIAASERDLLAAIYAAVQALPPERRSDEDIEAAIVFTISQRNLCPGVARAVLGMIDKGSPQFLRAVSRVRLSLLDGASIGTAGIANPGGNSGSGASFFSAPMAGVGGGAATYTR